MVWPNEEVVGVLAGMGKVGPVTTRAGHRAHKPYCPDRVLMGRSDVNERFEAITWSFKKEG